MEPTLRSLLIRDFRSISGEWEVPLDAGVVLIHGQNGAGKTSLLSALELAATGHISHLDRLGDDSYRSHLHHRGRRSGHVALETSGLEGGNQGSAMVTDAGAETAPLLNPDLCETFVERCFLPQATLGRLFEVYAPKESRGTDSPLIGFVKEVLGLDSLDALIDGLHAAGDLRRAQKVSSKWVTADDSVEDFERRRAGSEAARIAAQRRVDGLLTDLAKILGLSERGADLAGLVSRTLHALARQSDAEDLVSARVREAVLRLDALEAALTDAGLLAADPNEPLADPALKAAESRYREWQASRAEPLFRWHSERTSTEDEERPLPEPSGMLRQLRQEVETTESAWLDLRGRLSQLEALTQNDAGLRSRAREVDLELAGIAHSMVAVSAGESASSIASVLVSALEHVDGDLCPVCDQPFEKGGTLRQHVLAKIDSLNADAKRLLALEARRNALEGQRKALLRDLESHAAERERLGITADLEAEARATARVVARLKALEPIGEAGQLLADEWTRLRDAQEEVSRSRRLLERCLNDLTDIAASLNVDLPRGLLSQQVAALRAAAQAELEELSITRNRLVTAVRLNDDLSEARGRLKAATDAVSASRHGIAGLTAQISEAKRRKEVAFRLLKEAEAVRADVTTQVFDERLNGSWARIFGALVPSEPFVPQFKPIPSGSRKVNIEIETRHRDGEEGATPAAMLSQGNLNTAALSLFLALHFAVPPQLPWLIFDDPVQSMDDLHISNFASLVKQLARRNDRQVVIAVHERELFDYLALELSPASPSEQLLTIVLDRTYGQSVIAHERVRFTEDTALTPSDAA